MYYQIYSYFFRKITSLALTDYIVTTLNKILLFWYIQKKASAFRYMHIFINKSL